MKLTKKSILWKIWLVSVVVLGSFLLYMTIYMETKPTFLNLIFYIFLVVQLPLTSYLNKRKIENGKKEFGITGNISLDELESMWIEKDYQEKIAKKFKP